MKRKEFCDSIKECELELYIVAYSVLKHETDAEDAVCSAILKGYEHLAQLKNPHKFKAWMIAITRNEALQMKRKRIDMPGDDKLENLLEPIQDEHKELWDIVQDLKEEYRLVIVLFYYNNLSIRKIAEILDIPAGTVKSRLNRGRNCLRQALEEKG